MCGRFVQDTPTEVLIHRFAASERPAVPGLPPRYNVAPSQSAYVVGYNPR